MFFAPYLWERRNFVWLLERMLLLVEGVWCLICAGGVYCFKQEDGYGPPLWSSGQSSWLLNGDVLCFL
jgi:hypothetical protein